MSQALYRKYRSLKLKDVLGQDHVTNILERALDKGRIAHAYLLSGPRGTGKTSIARILAHEINQLPYTKESNHIDIIEIDAASNTGVDDIRSLREKSRIAPVSAKYKVYVIDEVHMLSKNAFNALLKTLEEPPEHVVFILATTDADKLPATILSRVQQYHFHPIASPVIAAHLIDIAKQEGIELTKEAADMIAERSNGGFRDSISLLDQLSSLADKDTPIDADLITASLGLPSTKIIENILDAYQAGKASDILVAVKASEDAGIDTMSLVNQLLRATRSRLTSNPELVRLIGELVKISANSYPDINLLVALLPVAPVQPAAPHRTSVAPLRAAQPKPVTINPSETIEATKLAAAVMPAPAPAKPAPKVPVKATAEIKPPVEPKQKTARTEPIRPISEFEWEPFAAAAKEQSIGLYSLLAKCGHEIGTNQLKIYGGTSFTKKKLEDPKNMQIIGGIISNTYGDDVEVQIISGTKPPADDKLAALADLMGGGEEVNLEEIS